MLQDRDLADEIAGHRALLLRLACNQLEDRTAAEDAVQETILAALAGQAQFQHRSSLKTWLISILRFKVLDVIRDRRKRQASTFEEFRMPSDTVSVDDFEVLFDERGCWAEPKDVWSDPQSAAEQKAFVKVLELCLTRLPEKTSRAFLMREWLETEPGEICEHLGVTPGNLRVLLYRARMQLRLCLETHWET